MLKSNSVEKRVFGHIEDCFMDAYVLLYSLPQLLSFNIITNVKAFNSNGVC